jgi:hypothetical protein
LPPLHGPIFPTLPQANLFIYNPGDIHRRYDPK